MILGLLAVMVHAVAENRKIDVALFQEQIILVVAVGVDESRHRLDDVLFLGFFELLQKRSAKHLVHESAHNALHF